MRAAHVALSFTCLTFAAIVGLPVLAEAQVSVFRLQAVNDSGVREGTCFVIRQETRAEGTFLVLVTSARLFEREAGRRARMSVDDRPSVEINAEAIGTPYANLRDIAVLKTVAAATPARGVFGFVRECEPDRVPEITPLAVSKSFLLRAVHGLNEPSTDVPEVKTGQPNPLPDY